MKMRRTRVGFLTISKAGSLLFTQTTVKVKWDSHRKRRGDGMGKFSEGQVNHPRPAYILPPWYRDTSTLSVIIKECVHLSVFDRQNSSENKVRCLRIDYWL